MREKLEPGLGILALGLKLFDEDDSMIRLELLQGFDVVIDLALDAGLFRVVRGGFANSGEKGDQSTTGGLGGDLGGILVHCLSFC